MPASGTSSPTRRRGSFVCFRRVDSGPPVTDMGANSTYRPEAVGLLSGERPEGAVYQRTCVEWQGLTQSGHAGRAMAARRTRVAVMFRTPAEL
jgi:hypothetical protein